MKSRILITYFFHFLRFVVDKQFAMESHMNGSSMGKSKKY